MRVRRVVDLSATIDENTQIYPGDPQVRPQPATTIAGPVICVLPLRLTGADRSPTRAVALEVT